MTVKAYKMAESTTDYPKKLLFHIFFRLAWDMSSYLWLLLVRKILPMRPQSDHITKDQQSVRAPSSQSQYCVNENFIVHYGHFGSVEIEKGSSSSLWMLASERCTYGCRPETSMSLHVIALDAEVDLESQLGRLSTKSGVFGGARSLARLSSYKSSSSRPIFLGSTLTVVARVCRNRFCAERA